MLQTRVFIIQFLGILVLLCGFLVSDPPDSLSVMHFHPDSGCTSVFSKASLSLYNNAVTSVSLSSHSNMPRKHETLKHLTFKIILPERFTLPFVACAKTAYNSELTERYYYQFFEEINPPPPELAPIQAAVA